MERDISAERRQISLQVIIGLVFMLIYLGLGYHYIHIENILTKGHRLAFALHWDIFIAATILVAILNVGARRFRGNEAALDGEQTAELRLPLAFLSNTMEQALVTVLVHLGLAVTLPSDALQLIPLLAILFVLGRLLFYFGYRHKAAWRALGFSMSILPATVGCIYVITQL